MTLLAKTQVTLVKPIFGLIKKPVPVCYIGENQVLKMADILSAQKITRVFICTDEVLFNLGLLNPMLAKLEEKGIKAFVFKDVIPDPLFSIAEKGAAQCRRDKCEAVIAFGGGSAIDCAKTIAAAVKNNKSAKKLKGMLKAKKGTLPFIAVPTTAGTGSEATIVAVVTEDMTHKKVQVIDPRIVPSIAILDPGLTTGLPKHITSTTAMDALTHAVEAYISKYANEETDSYGLQAIKMIYENIETACNEPGNIQARESLLVASFYAGLSFTRSFIGYVHAFSHNIGGKYGVAHGLANAVLLPHIMEVSKPKAMKRFAEISDYLELTSKTASVEKKADAFIQSLFELNKSVDIPERLEKFPREGIDLIVKAGFKEAHGTYPVPKYLSKKEAREILLKVCNK